MYVGVNSLLAADRCGIFIIIINFIWDSTGEGGPELDGLGYLLILHAGITNSTEEGSSR